MTASIRHVGIRNFKSLGSVAVPLQRLTVLVGPNGSGKSSFVQALEFVQVALAQNIEFAFNKRGGVGAVRRRSGGHPWHIGLRLGLDLGDGVRADYAFEIAAKTGERFRVSHERCVVARPLHGRAEFEIRDGTFKVPIPGIRPRVEPDRFALYAASATEEFRPVYDFLTRMRFYSIAPDRVREQQQADPGEVLKTDGSNAAAVLKRLRDQDSEGYDRVCRLLARAVEGVKRVEYALAGDKETLRFRMDIGLKHPWDFPAISMSDGTLRLLGLFLAVYQPGPASVVAVEEPEATVHPAIAELVLQVFRDAARERQILFTTHSPDLLDSTGLREEEILAVAKDRGTTVIAPLAPGARQALRDRLYTPGELLRVDELAPDLEFAHRSASQLDLFGRALSEPIEVRD